MQISKHKFCHPVRFLKFRVMVTSCDWQGWLLAGEQYLYLERAEGQYG